MPILLSCQIIYNAKSHELLATRGFDCIICVFCDSGLHISLPTYASQVLYELWMAEELWLISQGKQKELTNEASS